MKVLSRNLVLAALMIAGAAAAYQLTPRHFMAKDHSMDLEHMVPVQFGDWQDAHAANGVINPQQKETLDKIYSQLLSRTYVNRKTGQMIMLSIAYGQDQRDGMQLHYPEICYPAQGFSIRSNTRGEILTSEGRIPVRRLETEVPNQRYEPVTYWTMVGTRAVLGGSDKKLAEMSYSLRGNIPDGLLFRVSSVDRNSEVSFTRQQEFILSLLASLSPADKLLLSGLGQAR